MIFQVVAVHDSKARAFMVPFFSSHLAVAARSFSQAAENPGNQISGSPEDFSLWHLGTWDDDTGAFKLFDVPINLGFATKFQKGALSVQPKVA